MEDFIPLELAPMVPILADAAPVPQANGPAGGIAIPDGAAAPAPAPGNVPGSDASVISISDDEEEEDPEEIEFESGNETTESDELPVSVSDGPAASRPDCINVFMPFTPMEHFDNLAYAFVNPPAASPAHFIRRALQEEGGNPPFAILHASQGAGVVIFASNADREQAVDYGAFLGREHCVHLTRHEDTNNRFLFAHDELVAISIEDFPMEHWTPPHIVHSTGPFANPYLIDPICLSGLDYSVVLVTVKARGLSDILHADVYALLFL
jgi:hypothetical protein